MYIYYVEYICRCQMAFLLVFICYINTDECPLLS